MLWKFAIPKLVSGRSPNEILTISDPRLERAEFFKSICHEGTLRHASFQAKSTIWLLPLVLLRVIRAMVS